MKSSLATSVLLLCSLSTVSTTAIAEDTFSFDGLIGFASLTQDNYDNPLVADASFGYSTPAFGLRIGIMNYGNIANEKNTNNTTANVQLDSIYLGIEKKIPAGKASVEVGAGVAFSRIDAEYTSVEVANTNETSPYVSVKFDLPLTPKFSLLAGGKYLNDVSGSDIRIIQAGVRVSF